MRIALVGLGVQGRKRLELIGRDAVATVDIQAPGAQYQTLDQVPLASYDAAFVCTADQAKLDLLRLALSQGKHVLVEKPLLATHREQLQHLKAIAQDRRVACYTAYNHRFEPHVARLREILQRQTLGQVYLARFFYGNGTARNVRESPWRDQGFGVLADLGSHLLDLALFLFGPLPAGLAVWSSNCFENRSCDHVCFGGGAGPVMEFEATLLSWRNTFTIDIYGELGSVHVRGLCKWGASTLTVRRRVFPSGRPEETEEVVEGPDPTWALEYQYFRQLCMTGETNIGNDLVINDALASLAEQLPARP